VAVVVKRRRRRIKRRRKRGRRIRKRRTKSNDSAALLVCALGGERDRWGDFTSWVGMSGRGSGPVGAQIHIMKCESKK
jgi:hypothetical protein